MGENKHIKELDAFATKYIKEINIEHPSLDFTKSIMQTLLKEKKSKVFATNALISKKGWFVIFMLVLLVIFIPFKTSENSLLKTLKIDFYFFDTIQIPSIFIDFSVSNTSFYAILLFGLMVMIQVFFLKNYFEKRIN